jgi:hypothetical protein
LGLKLILDAGKPGAKKIQPGRQEQMQVPALRHVAAWCDGIREALALEHDNRRGLVRQGSGGEQAGHAAADNDHATFTQRHHGTPPARTRILSRLDLRNRPLP